MSLKRPQGELPQCGKRGRPGPNTGYRKPAASVLRIIYHLIDPLPPEFRGADTFRLPELTVQIAGVVEPAGTGDFLQSTVRKAKKLFCPGQTAGDNILSQRDTVILVKFPGQMVFADKEPFREIIQRKFFRIMFIQVLAHLGHFQTVGVFFFF